MIFDTKGVTAGYWAATGLLGAALLGGGIMDLVGPPELVETLESLGYPLYLMPLLGVAKLLAGVAILAPNFQRLKEWAYAGVAVDFLGASYSHAVNQQFDDMATPLLLTVLMFMSWYLRPAHRELPDVATAA
ncbi:hypothetical protein ENSA5_07550 [Enhygromyxa salina]|uniref:DoxX-like family protein n=1 Tax=Enhygromyxa salina TaxID=215803 RepID=A0A2S9YHD7_9BACT|nr:DoxX family protein [Enhygromyxa salina]PRQ04524.1 hypothetical protein ENSA5_07550 [Enhygromyxa salina]